MADHVKVEDSEVFTLFRAAMIKFAHAAGQSLSSADSQVSRTHSWLENEQTSYWQNQVRKRSEAVAKARDAVRQKKLYKDSTGKMRDAIEEEKFLAQCVAAFEHAQKKLESVRKWIPRLEKASDLYRGGVSRLSRNLDGDLPNAIALLERLGASLEQYIQIEVPSGTADSAVLASTDESMSRGAEPAQAPAAAGAAVQVIVVPTEKSPSPAPAEAPDVRQ